MPALYIPKAGSFETLVNQLHALQTLAPDTFSDIETTFKTLYKTPHNETSIIIQMAAFAANETIQLNQEKSAIHIKFQKIISSAYNNLNPVHIERHQLTNWQQSIKQPETLSEAGDLIGRSDAVKWLHRILQDENQGIESGLLGVIHSKASILHNLLTSSAHIHRDKESGKVTETQYSFEQSIKKPPNIIFIMGNNDLRQIDFIASLYRTLKSTGLKIYVSGYGGHGTMHDSVFSLSEGETMVKRLLDQGVSQQDIIAEYDAVDTGRNVKYMDSIILLEYVLKRHHELQKKNNLSEEENAFLANSELTPEKINFLQQMQTLGTHKRSGVQDEKLAEILKPSKEYLLTNNIPIHHNILISGTPGGLLRQTRTYEQQTTLPWENICCLTPHEFNESYENNYYYATPKAALINFIYALREVASFLDYTVNKEFLSARMLNNEDKLRDALHIFHHYYTKLARPEHRIDRDEFINDFILFSKHKSNNEVRACEALRKKLNLYIVPCAEYFRKVFLDIEHEHLKQESLSHKMTATQQAALLDTGKTYARLGLIEATFFYKHKQVPAPNHVTSNGVSHLKLKAR